MVAIEVAAVVFLATVIRSAFGFGEALVAVPLLALAIPVEVAAPVAVLVSITVALIVVLQDWRSIHIRSAVSLVLPTLLGIPVGLLVLKTVPERLVKILLAAVIVGFSAWSLMPRAHVELKNDRMAVFFGFLAGVLGGAYGMNGPPLAIYGSLRRWAPAKLSRHAAGILFSRESRRNGGVLVCGPVDSRSEPVLSRVIARRAACDSPGPDAQ